MDFNSPHIPVLPNEVLDLFKDIQKGVIVDCTLGYGGHTSLLLKTNKDITIIGIDQDQTAIEFSKKRLQNYNDRFEIKKGKFSKVLKTILQDHLDIKGILADIGVSSLHLDDKNRGFSFDSQTLDMRMDITNTLTAKEVINFYDKDKLEYILKEYGEIKQYKKIADFIIKNRPYNSTKQLADDLLKILPKNKKIHPATLVFQAIRIEVNDELGELNRLLDTIENSSLNDTIVAIISFHSLEDRIVKKRFSKWAKKCICPPETFKCQCGSNNSIGKIITKKPITAKDDEIKNNNRSRSAKLRVFKIER